MTKADVNQQIMDIAVKVNDRKFVDKLAQKFRENGLTEGLSQADAEARTVQTLSEPVPDDIEQQDVAALLPDERELMATLALCGYRFHRGTLYWRVISPTNMTVWSLGVLQECIQRATDHHEKEQAK